MLLLNAEDGLWSLIIWTCARLLVIRFDSAQEQLVAFQDRPGIKHEL